MKSLPEHNNRAPCYFPNSVVVDTFVQTPALSHCGIHLTYDYLLFQPSDALITGKIKGVDCVLLARLTIKFKYFL